MRPAARARRTANRIPRFSMAKWSWHDRKSCTCCAVRITLGSTAERWWAKSHHSSYEHSRLFLPLLVCSLESVGDGRVTDGGRPGSQLVPHREDRKSTRLNSSHGSISYAV